MPVALVFLELALEQARPQPVPAGDVEVKLDALNVGFVLLEVAFAERDGFLEMSREQPQCVVRLRLQRAGATWAWNQDASCTLIIGMLSIAVGVVALVDPWGAVVLAFGRGSLLRLLGAARVPSVLTVGAHAVAWLVAGVEDAPR